MQLEQMKTEMSIILNDTQAWNKIRTLIEEKFPNVCTDTFFERVEDSMTEILEDVIVESEDEQELESQWQEFEIV